MPAAPLVQSLLPRLFEDELFLAVEKPAGLDVGGLEGQMGVIEILTAVRRKPESLSVVNRLSRYESGVLLLAKSPEAAEFVRTGLKSGRVEHEFVAVVVGRMKQRRMVLEPERTGSAALRQKSELATDRRAARNKSRAKPTQQRARVATTTLFQVEDGQRRTLVRCHTFVPNTHVLRAQLRSVRLRLVGDNVHDPSPKRQLNEATCLHLAKMTFHHPALKSRVGVTSPAPDFRAVMEGGFHVERVLRAALARRLPLLIEKNTDSFRLMTGPLEGLKGIHAELFGDVVILYVLDEKFDERTYLTRIGRWYISSLGAASVYVKPFLKDRVAAAESVDQRLHSPKPLLGKPAPESFAIRERNVRFLVRPYDGYSVGLFLDHRDNRARIHDLARGADVLNLFAFTCGFSVAAAVGGAASTTSVDVSARNLDWGIENFELNHIDVGDSQTASEDGEGSSTASPRKHLFVRSDALDFLRRARRQEKSYDLMVIDPPSFAHGRGSKKDFSIVNDLPELIAAACQVLRPGGTMMVSTNYRRMGLRDLKDLVRKGTGQRRTVFLESPALPLDFSIDRDHAKTVFVGLEAGRSSRGTVGRQAAGAGL